MAHRTKGKAQRGHRLPVSTPEFGGSGTPGPLNKAGGALRRYRLPTRAFAARQAEFRTLIVQS